MKKFILIQYLTWHFIDSPKAISKAWKNFLLFNLNYFSVPLLLRTFFSHWRKYYYSYGKGLNPGRWFEAFVFNMFSRIIGAILRTIFIIIGIAFEVLIVVAGLIILIAWILLPLLLLAVLWFGFRLIF